MAGDEDNAAKIVENGIRAPGRPTPGPVYTSWGDMARHWPLTTLCIVANEFCERFSYYGMRTVLTFYILNILKFDDNTTTIFFNSFTILCYVTPMLGAIVADGFIGMFWTIFSVSILYACGQVLLAISSVQSPNSPWHPVVDLIGLITIGFGTGGIKPCVAPFGGNQFEKHQERMISVYFSMFYFSINAGSMISTFISPIFRAQPCLGQDSCYPLCFGIPAILMLVATGVFMAGSFWYKKELPKDSVFKEVAKIISIGVYNAFRGKGPKRDHVIQHYLDTHDCELDPKCLQLREEKRRPNACQKAIFVMDVHSLLRVLVMFLPMPMFWALYDQQSSVWLLQAIQMDCNVFGFLLLPDQMQTLNAVLILLFIPIFQAVIYPVIEIFFKMTSLRRMVGGGWLAALAFLVTGLVQLQVNTTLPQLPDSSSAFVSFMSIYDTTTNCSIVVSPLTDPKLAPFTLLPNTSMVDVKEDDKSTFHVPTGSFSWGLTYSDACKNKDMLPMNVTYSFPTLTKQNIKDGHSNVFSVVIGPDGIFRREMETRKPTSGTGEFNIGVTLTLKKEYNGNLAVCRDGRDLDDFDPKHPCNPQSSDDFYFWERDYNGHTDDLDSSIPMDFGNQNVNSSAYAFKSVKPGRWKMYFMYTTPKDIDNPPTKSREETVVEYSGVDFAINGQGGVYSLVITGPGGNMTNHKKHVYQVVQDNRVSILWQVPQIVILTAAEILFSVTGNEFSYSQAAPSMKSVVQAFFLLTTACGDGIIVAITAADLFDNMAVQFFVYAAAMFIVICIFALLAIFYFEYANFATDDDDEEEKAEDGFYGSNLTAIDNEAFVPNGKKHDPDNDDLSSSERF